MSLIGEVTFINQNMHIPAAVYADSLAREHISKEFQRIINEEKERKIEEIREIEKSEKILAEGDLKEDTDREIKHLDFKV